MNTKQLVLQYLKTRKLTLITYFIACLMYYPLHIVTFTIIFGKIFDNLNNIDLNKQKIIYLSLAVVILYVIENTSIILKEKIESYIIPEFNNNLRNMIFENIIKKLRVNFKDLDIGEVISRISLITVKWDEITGYIAGSLFPKTLTMVMILIILLIVDKFYALITGIYIILVFIIMSPRYQSCFNKFVGVRNSMNDRSNHMQDKISNLFDIYLSNKENEEIENNRKKEKKYNDKYESALKCNLKNSFIISLCNVSYLAFIVYHVVNSLINKTIPNNIGITVLLIMTYVVNLTDQIFNHFSLAAQAYSVLKESESFLDYISNYTIDKRQLKPKITGMIKIQNLTFKYNKDIVLKNVNLMINPNNKVIIKGKSGSGKSTLIKLICGFYNVNNGKILIDNTNINNINLTYLRSNISMLNQNVKLFNISIYDNIKYNNHVSNKEIDNFIKKYQINLYNKLDLGMLAGQNGNNLSGGQKQMTLLIRVLLNSKKILILDEPTSALDNYHFNCLLNIINSISRTIIIITHDSRFDKVKMTNKYHLENTILKKTF